MFLIRAYDEQALFAVAWSGVPAVVAGSFAVNLDDWSDPLVNVLHSHQRRYFPEAHSAADRRRRPQTPLADAGFHVAPITCGNPTDEALGLLLVSAGSTLPRDFDWFIDVFAQKVDQIFRHQERADLDHRQGRERSLLYSIINAVTDPILLTDTEGRLLIANARALTLFTASEEDSVGRRSAVRMNNMLL
jgi:PAS domain-containing protein